jgi:long-subunit fatty acid transport protein
MFRRIKKSTFLLVLLLMITGFAEAQTRVSSPFSRYGIGDMYSNNNARSLALGGISQGLRVPTSINYSNPASYIIFDSASFNNEAGLISNSITLKTASQSQSYTYSNLGYLTFGFPVTRWWGASFGLVPYSNVGYNIKAPEVLDSIGYVDYIYEGSGGFNKAYFGNSFKVAKGLSVGFNASFLFGSSDKIRTLDFHTDSSDFFDLEVRNSVIINGMDYEFGLQYELEFGKSNFLVLGATYHNATEVKGKNDYLVRRFAGSVETNVIDTLINITQESGKILIPQSFAGGFSLGSKDQNFQWMLGADVKWQKWSDFELFGVKDSLKDDLQISFGGEIVPTPSSNSYFKRMHYRIGGRYHQLI